MSALQMMQMMMSRTSATVGIANVGSKVSPQTLTPTTAGAYSMVLPLPSGCSAGDTATISCIASIAGGLAWGTLVDATIALSSRTLDSIFTIIVYVYPLSAPDISAGSISVPYSITTSGGWNISAMGIVDVDRGTDGIDVVGTYASGAINNGENATAIPSVTTNYDGDLIRYSIFRSAPSNSTNVVTPPAGFTAGNAPASITNGAVDTALKEQATAGVTGSTAPTIFSSGYDTFAWGGVLLALKPYTPPVPAITYVLNLPAPTVGATYTGSIVATLVDGATGPITFSGTLPAGITYGTVTVSGNTYTQPIGGTPTTAGTTNPAFAITNGTITVNPTYSFVVAAAASGLTLLTPLTAVETSSASHAFTLTNVSAGDLIVFEFACSTDHPTWSFGCSDSAGNTYAQVSRIAGGGGLGETITYAAISPADKTGLVVTGGYLTHNGGGQYVVYQIKGGAAIPTGVSARYADALMTAGQVVTSAPFSVAAGGILLVAVQSYIYGAGSTITFGGSPTLSYDGLDVTAAASNYSAIGHYATSSAISGGTMTFVVNPTGSRARMNYTIMSVNPA